MSGGVGDPVSLEMERIRVFAPQFVGQVRHNLIHVLVCELGWTCQSFGQQLPG